MDNSPPLKYWYQSLLPAVKPLGVLEATPVFGVPSGGNFVYTDKSSFVVKMAKPENGDEGIQKLGKEILLSSYLKPFNISTVPFVDEVLFTMEGYGFTVWQFLPGRTLSNEKLKPKHAGKVAGLVPVLQDYLKTAPGVSPTYDRHNVLLEKAIIKHPSNKRMLLGFMEFLPPMPKNLVVAHTDLHSENVMKSEQGFKILDLEGVSYAPAEIDYAVALAVYLRRGGSVDVVGKVFRRYEKVGIRTDLVKVELYRALLLGLFDYLFLDTLNEVKRNLRINTIVDRLENLGFNEIKALKSFVFSVL